MLGKIGKSLKDISNFSVLLVLFMFVYTLLGMEIFSYSVMFNEAGEVTTKLSEGEYPRANFNYFVLAFTSVFIVLAGEDWNTVMYDHVRATNGTSVIFFVSLVILGNFILLNLFLAILLKNFEEKDEDEETGATVEEEKKKSIMNNVSARIKNIFGKLKKDNKESSSKSEPET